MHTTLKVDAYEHLRDILGLRHFDRHHSAFVDSFRGIGDNVNTVCKHQAFISNQERRKIWQEKRWVCIMQKLAKYYDGKF